ncbi:MAG: hypothetical protein KDC73_07760 [Ignavibacteriae bacterium]|nr:hypothetical protein [Ignavibacteriota bacterium]MCB9242399.1 hypothetical protein [Ignavibacteriales bacterium]
MRSLLLAVFMAFIFLSCNSNDPGGGLVGWNDPYAGSEILVTNEQGEILGGDYDDWCLRDTTLPTNELSFYFGPAYPNPSSGPSLAIQFGLKDSAVVDFYFQSDTSRYYILDNMFLPKGTFQSYISTGNLPIPHDTIVQLKLHAEYSNGTVFPQVFECEGDVLITN